MKLKLLFGLVFVAVCTQQGESALKSSIRNEIVQILNDINSLVGEIATEANEYFLERLQNETQIKEWSVNIQVEVTTGITALLFDVLNAYKDYVVSVYGSAIEEKVLTCISDQDADLLASVQNATSLFGWCNNRLAANLTSAFQDVTANLVNISNDLAEDITSLSTCLLGDDICFANFLVKVVALLKAELDTSGDTLLTALEDVLRVYSIMFGQDVPKCNVEYLAPGLLEGIQTALSNILTCFIS